MKALIFDIYKGTTGDGPGMRDTVFFKGCPLSCKWCHNPEGIDFKNRVWWESRTCIGCGLCGDICKNKAIFLGESGVEISPDLCQLCHSCTETCPTKSITAVAQEYTVDELSAEIIKDKEYFESSGGGVTASGGEAMMHLEFLYEFFSQMKKESVSTALDTTGFCDSEKLFKILQKTDILLYDLKVIDPSLHKKWTGVDNNTILENITLVSEYIISGNQLRLWIRTPIIPGFTDDAKIISEIADFIKSNLFDSVERWELCSFNNSCTHKYEKLGKKWELEESSLISKEIINQLLSVAEKSGVPEIITSGIIKE